MNSSIPAWYRIPGCRAAAFGLTAAAAATAGPALAQSNAASTEVTVKTADGACDAVLFHPNAKGKWPAVLIWPDIMGLRPAFRDMGAPAGGPGLYRAGGQSLLSQRARAGDRPNCRFLRSRNAHQADPAIAPP